MNTEVPRGLRNNNPGNIRLNWRFTWQGQVSGSDPDFCTFDSPVDGIRAIGLLIYNYQHKDGCNSIQTIINRWAPPVENDTGAYVNAISTAAGVQPTDHVDTSDATMLSSIVTAIIEHENGQQPYSTDEINQAVQEVLS